jgi:hypothetical protein
MSDAAPSNPPEADPAASLEAEVDDAIGCAAAMSGRHCAQRCLPTHFWRPRFNA